MSTLVVVRKGSKAVIASDSVSSYGSTLLPSEYDASPDKIIQVGETLLGVVGCAAHSLVMEHLFDTRGEEFRFDTTKNIFSAFRKIHPILKAEYFLKPEEDDEIPYESSQIDALLANRHGIFGVHTLREVYQYTRFWATGSGWTYALGAMEVSYDRLESATDIARAAVRAACVFDQGSAGPIQLKEVTLDN